MKIYTKTGDSGETSLFGGKRVKKNCIEIDAIGDIDETNAFVGILVAELPESGFEEVKEKLNQVQHKLFNIGSNVAAVQMSLGEMPKIEKKDIEAMENWIDEMHESLEPLSQFILPGGHPAAAHAFLARAICRRAERRFVDLKVNYPELDPLLGQYLNRLSDVLFALSRYINQKSGVEDVTWQK